MRSPFYKHYNPNYSASRLLTKSSFPTFTVMPENSSEQALQRRRKIIRDLGLRFIKNTLAAIQNMQPVQALEILNHLFPRTTMG